MKQAGCVVLLLIPAFFTGTWLLTAVHHLFELGENKTRIKKEHSQLPAWKRFLLIGYAEGCEYHSDVAKRLCYLFWAYALVALVCMTLLLLSLVLPQVQDILIVCVYIKLIVLDIPVDLFGFVMTKRGKHGGVTWRWEAK